MDLETQDLLAAITANDEPRVEFLLASHPKLAEARNADGVSALLLALYRGQQSMAAKIAAQKIRLNIFEAAAMGQVETLKKLVATDPMHLRSTSGDGFPALHLAAFFGQLEAVEFLLAAGAGVGARSTNPMDNTALHAAMVFRHVEVARVLLEHGAAVNARQHGGFTALHAAAFHNDEKMAELLLSRGADKLLKTDEGKTAQDIALDKGFDVLAAKL